MQTYTKRGLCLLLTCAAMPVLPVSANSTQTVFWQPDHQLMVQSALKNERVVQSAVSVFPLFPADPVEVELIQDGKAIDVFSVEPVSGCIAAGQLKLPAGITLVEGKAAYPVRPGQKVLQLQAKSVYEKTLINITFQQKDQKIGTAAIERAIPADEKQNIELAPEFIPVPKGFALADSKSSISVPYGKTTDVTVEVVPAETEVPVELHLLLASDKKTPDPQKPEQPDPEKPESPDQNDQIPEPDPAPEAPADDADEPEPEEGQQDSEIEAQAEDQTEDDPGFVGPEQPKPEENEPEVPEQNQGPAKPEQKPETSDPEKTPEVNLPAEEKPEQTVLGTITVMAPVHEKLAEIDLNEVLPEGLTLPEGANPILELEAAGSNAAANVEVQVKKDYGLLHVLFEILPEPKKEQPENRTTGDSAAKQQADHEQAETEQPAKDQQASAEQADPKAEEPEAKPDQDSEKKEQTEPEEQEKPAVHGELVAEEYYVIKLACDQTLNLNQLNISLPQGFSADGTQKSGYENLAEVKPGNVVEAVLPVTNKIAKTTVEITYLDGEKEAGTQSISISEPTLDGKVPLNQNQIKLPEGYQLKADSAALPIRVLYGDTTECKVQVEPTQMKGQISFKLEDGTVVETQNISKEDGTIKLEDLKIPDSCELVETFKDVSFKDNERIDIVVKFKEENKKAPVTFTITYKDKDGNTTGSQTKTIEVKNEYAILTEDMLELPEGYALSEPFEEIVLAAGESKNLTMGVMPNMDSSLKEASFQVIYKDSNGTEVGHQNIILHGSDEILLQEKDLRLPNGYKLANSFQPVKYEGKEDQRVELTVEKDSRDNSSADEKEAVFKIAYKDPEGNTISTETVRFKGTSGSASLEQSSIKVPSGYKIKGNYTAPTCEYGKQLSIEIKVEKDSSAPGDSSGAPGDSSGEKAEAILDVVYYVQEGGDRKIVKKETFKSGTTGDKGDEFIFVKDQTFKVKAPNGYVMVNTDVAPKVSVDYGNSGQLDVQVKLTSIHTAANSNRTGLSTWFMLSMLGFAGLFYLRRKEYAGLPFDSWISYPTLNKPSDFIASCDEDVQSMTMVCNEDYSSSNWMQSFLDQVITKDTGSVDSIQDEPTRKPKNKQL